MGYRMGLSLTPELPPQPPNWGVEGFPFVIPAKRLEIDKARLIKHILALTSCFEQIIQLSPKPQVSERRSNNMCRTVVERPDHRFGDDLVRISNSVASSHYPTH